MSNHARLNASMTRHLMYVREGLLLIRQELERRGCVHDASKFSDAEFDGFARINAAARNHPYGSPEYRAGLAQERDVIHHHNIVNSHHPEHHNSPIDMGLFDLIEMVCDWRGAGKGYGNTSFRDGLKIQRERFRFTPEQWWVIDQLADFFDPPRTPREGTPRDNEETPQ